MSSVKDFMNAGEIKKFSCGKNFGFLNRLFSRMSDADKAEKLLKIKDIISQSETGRETLAFLEKNETKIVFEKSKGYGFYAPEKNTIVLNRKASDQDLALTLIHEARHAKQDKTMENISLEMTPETLLKNGFMIEADACAAECVFAHEMMEKGNRSFFDAQQKSIYAPIGAAFEKEMAESGNANKAREAAMLKWYDLDVVRESYGDQYVALTKFAAEKWVEDPFTKSVSVKEMADKLCVDAQGKGYLSDPSVLDRPEKIMLDDCQSVELKRNIYGFCQAKKRGLDGLGLDKIFTRHYDGKVTTFLFDMTGETRSPVMAACLKRGAER